MTFTNEEFQEWHRAKREREWKPRPAYQSPLRLTCIHCGLPFNINDGVVTEEVALCDVCNGD
jgi:hypothetical protein